MVLKLQQLARPTFRGFLLQKGSLQIGLHNGQQAAINGESKIPLVSSKNFDLSWSLAALNINPIQTPPHRRIVEERTPPPLPIPLLKIIDLPQIKTNVSYEDRTPIKSIEEPSGSALPEKQAARLIIIRRKKMKKHKLKKLRKKMKFEYLKIRQKREMKKEKLFQAMLIERIKLAESFDPAKYAAEKIAKAKEVELPPTWYGVKYPEWAIKVLIEQKEKKMKEKEADEKRRASMSPYVKDYLKDLPK